MKIYESLAGLPAFASPVELAIGMFDGVHRGHQAVIDGAVRLAREKGGTSAVLTFAPHPSRVLTPESPTLLLQSLAARCVRVAALGVDALIVQPFTPEFSQLPPAKFVQLLRHAIPGSLGINVGENFRFGHGGAGDFRKSETYLSGRSPGNCSGLEISFVHPGLEDGDERISSTRIRELLAGGEIARANTLLGWNYQSLARSVPGRALGRTIGFPTLNMPWTPELLPRFGVYAVRVRKMGDYPTNTEVLANTDCPIAPGAIPHSRPSANDWLLGIANYGLRPTVETAPVLPLLEVHLFAEAATLAAQKIGPGANLLVEWLHFIRPEQKFPTLPALLSQIRLDAQTARQQLQRLPLSGC